MAAHNESIYCLIPPPVETATKTKMYRSKFPPNIAPTASTFGTATVGPVKVSNLAGDTANIRGAHKYKLEGANFGPRELHLSDTSQFLTAHTTAPLPNPTPYAGHTTMKPPVVKRGEKPVINRNDINFIKRNAVANVLSEPLEVRSSDTQRVNYLKKADFGQVPSYLTGVKKELATERQYVQDMMQRTKQQNSQQGPRVAQMPEEERLMLLQDLKQKWEVVNRQYQLMTHIVQLDTHGKTKRKEEFELQLSQLERSIEKLSKPNVFVQFD